MAHSALHVRHRSRLASSRLVATLLALSVGVGTVVPVGLSWAHEGVPSEPCDSQSSQSAAQSDAQSAADTPSSGGRGEECPSLSIHEGGASEEHPTPGVSEGQGSADVSAPALTEGEDSRDESDTPAISEAVENSPEADKADESVAPESTANVDTDVAASGDSAATSQSADTAQYATGAQSVVDPAAESQTVATVQSGEGSQSAHAPQSGSEAQSTDGAQSLTLPQSGITAQSGVTPQSGTRPQSGQPSSPVGGGNEDRAAAGAANTGRELWVINGAATDTFGDGTEGNPFRNLTTALARAQAGDTIKLKTDITVTGSSATFTIGKNVTIDGNGNVLRLRGPDLALGADVTLKNMSLNLIKESQASGTIWMSGYALTLDGVSTRIGLNQTGQRPHIVTGTYGAAPSGPNARLLVTNASDETRFASIVAGDPDQPSAIPVTIDLDSRNIRVEDAIYLAPPGVAGQTGTVDLASASNFIERIVNPASPAGAGARSVTFDNTFLSELSIDDVDHLTINGGAVTLAKGVTDLDVSGVLSVEGGARFDSAGSQLKAGQITGDGTIRIHSEGSAISGGTEESVTWEVYRLDNNYVDHVGRAYITTGSPAINPSVTLLPAGAPYQLVKDAAGTWKLERITLNAKTTPTGRVTLRENGVIAPIAAGDFQFTVEQDVDNWTDSVTGVPTGPVSVQANGTLNLGTWTFAEEGDWFFTIRQVKGNKAGVTYDMEPIQLHIEVLTAFDGKPIVRTRYDKAGKRITRMEFANTRVPTQEVTAPPLPNTGGVGSDWIYLSGLTVSGIGLAATIHLIRMRRKYASSL
ncbi:MAG: FctA domain-containing protein [Actinomycetaceae bacterium]|nr:FctA domain-containing protein [Actinomycetaceae bacterium]